jgi:hypothetical protein
MRNSKFAAKLLATAYGLDPVKLWLWAERHHVDLAELYLHLMETSQAVYRAFEEALLNDLPFNFERKRRHE